VGILGHVDAGKTTITSKLSQVLSTASLDKNPQSQERGITLDLGFSCFRTNNVDPNQRVNLSKDESTDNSVDPLQFTIVDCPGHASLFRTVIAGSNIVDIILIVVDVVEGIQTQTSEYFILSEILKSNSPIIFILNKIDKISSEDLYGSIDKNPK